MTLRHKIVIAFLVIQPLWIHGQVSRIGKETFVNFAYPKFILLILAAILLLPLIKSSKNTIAVGLAILSTAAVSLFPKTSLLGYLDLRTGVITYLCGLVLMEASKGLTTKPLLYALVPYTIIDSCIGLLSYFNLDVFSLLSLIIVGHFVNTANSIHYSTILSQQDYSSGFGAVCYVIFTYYSRDSRWFYLCSFLAASIVLTSLATVGFLTVILILSFLIYFCSNRRILLYQLFFLFLLFVTLYLHNPGILHETLLLNGGIISDRLTIFTNTWKLICQQPWFGHGLDTFVYYAYTTFDQHLSKPHNFYLAFAFGAGVPALAGFLLFVGTSIRPHMAMGIFLGLVAMLIQFLSNDATIETLPIFFILCGVLTKPTNA